MRYDTWLTLSGKGLDFDAISAGSPSREADFGGKLSHPARFAVYRDPEGRYQLPYPRNWILTTGNVVEVRSKRLPLCARIEVLPGPELTWETLRDRLGFLISEKRLPGPPAEVRGEIVEREGIVDARALAYPSGCVVVVVSTRMARAGNPGMDRYGSAVLAAIRREFCVPAP